MRWSSSTMALLETEGILLEFLPEAVDPDPRSSRLLSTTGPRTSGAATAQP